MTITPEQARELLDGARPGPWYVYTVPDGTFIYDDMGHMCIAVDQVGSAYLEADLTLAAAAPDLTQTIASMRWEYGVIYEDEGEWPMVPGSWWPSIDAAIINHRRRNLTVSAPAHRLVRRLVGPVEVIDGE